MEKVSHHYVPQFYLKNFSTNRKSIGLYILERCKYIQEASIKTQACKDHLYGEDSSIEDMFMELESHAALILREIINTHQIPDQSSPEYEALLFFILISEGRNLKNADSVDNLTDFSAKLMMKMDRNYYFSDEEIEGIKISMNIPNLLSLQAIAKSYPILFDLKCKLIVSKCDRQFITSDNPLVRYNQMYSARKYMLRGYGLGNMGLQMFFPISPKLCICIFDNVMYEFEESVHGNIEVNKGKQIDEINKLIYLNSYKSVYFNDTVKPQYIQRIVSSHRHTTAEISKEISTFGPEGQNQLMIVSPRRVKEKINLAMFKIRRDFINMPLPSHMAGPVRPYAKAFIENSKQSTWS